MSAGSTGRNKRTALTVVAVVAGMVGMSYAAVPAYRAFCQITGWGGTTSRAEAASDTVLAREITVRFDASLAADMPWRFAPEQVAQTMRIGESMIAFYNAENLSGAPVSGTASFNVQPAKAGEYFKKIECFCFTEQTLKAAEAVRMPVTYFIDPAIADDPRLDDVQTITLSYTFHRMRDRRAADKV